MNNINLKLKQHGIKLDLRVVNTEAEKKSVGDLLCSKGITHYDEILDARNKRLTIEDYECHIDTIYFYGSLKHLIKTEKNENVKDEGNRLVVTFKDEDFFCMNKNLPLLATTLFIYSNLITHQHVGSQSAKLIRTIVLPDDDGHIDVDFNHYYYFIEILYAIFDKAWDELEHL